MKNHSMQDSYFLHISFSNNKSIMEQDGTKSFKVGLSYGTYRNHINEYNILPMAFCYCSIIL